MTQTTSETLWSVIQTCVNEGCSVLDFLKACKAHWTEALRDRQVCDVEEWQRIIKQEVL